MLSGKSFDSVSVLVSVHDPYVHYTRHYGGNIRRPPPQGGSYDNGGCTCHGCKPELGGNKYRLPRYNYHKARNYGPMVVLKDE